MKNANAVTALPTSAPKHTQAEEIARLQRKVLEHDESAQALFEAILDALAKHGNTTHNVKALAIAGRDLFSERAYQASEEAPEGNA
ncbi:MAG: hypothetical protein WBF84_12750 [Castellaniella sp.]|uniref:hypothetical protein n=1 Tax=Castellaniella sp. TaxID=1955812 RepID=UPI003C7733A8